MDNIYVYLVYSIFAHKKLNYVVLVYTKQATHIPMTDYRPIKCIDERRRSPREHKMPRETIYDNNKKIKINQKVVHCAMRNKHPLLSSSAQQIYILDGRDSNTARMLLKAGFKPSQITQITNDPKTHYDHDKSGLGCNTLLTNAEDFVTHHMPYYGTVWLDFCGTFTTNQTCITEAIQAANGPGVAVEIFATFCTRGCRVYRQFVAKTNSVKERRTEYMHYMCKTLSKNCHVQVGAAWYMFYGNNMVVIRFRIDQNK